MNKEITKQYREYVRKLIDAKVVAGYSAYVLNKDGKVLFNDACGYADMALGTAATDETVYQLMSMSKAYCNAAVMRMVEQGKIDLDKEAGDYLDAYKKPLVIDHWDEENDMPVLRPAKTPLTIRSLLNCTSGVATQAAYDTKRFKYESRFSIVFAEPCQWHAPLSFDPGTDWAYNAGWNILAEIVLAVDGNGRDWAHYLEDVFFKPLELTSTTCLPYSDPDIAPRVAQIHIRQADNTLRSNTVCGFKASWFGKPEYWRSYGGRDATNCVFSSASDYAKFLAVFLNKGVGLNGVRILSEESVEEMRKNQIGDLIAHWVTDKKLFNTFESEPDFFYGQQPMKWGLGFLVNEKETLDGRGKNALAWFGGADTYFTADIENGLAIVAMMANSPSAHPACVSVFRNLERAVHDLPLIEVDPDELNKQRAEADRGL
ncbi:MAG: beta-lactamase family protein [Erysipelotrichaceae bacterium]|nr:beta-lactamase family protein [Erysipelotrichaceae bacterium]